jgi:hypothetical protein
VLEDRFLVKVVQFRHRFVGTQAARLQ